tara:strand:+ start:4967 stop:5473 length:507 start_codon:yes stop_codon:yes gene_type:complete
MNELVTALKSLKADYVMPPLASTVEKDSLWVDQQLMSQGWIWDGTPVKVGDRISQIKRLPLDRKYRVCSKQDFMHWIEWDWVDKKKYVSEHYDCENFAFSFKARTDRKFGINTVGLVIDYSGGHAYNLVLFSDSPPLLYEPQTDEWVYIGEGMSANESYKMQQGYIII